MSHFAVFETQSAMAMDLECYSNPPQAWSNDFDFQSANYEHHATQPTMMPGMRGAGYSQQYDMSVAVDRYMQDAVDTLPFCPDMAYENAHYLRPMRPNEVAYRHSDPRLASPTTSIHIHNDREDSDSISSGTHAYSVGHCDDPHSSRVSQPYYSTVNPHQPWSLQGDMPSMPISSPQVSHVGSHFVNPSQVEHVPAPHDQDMSELDAEGEEDPDASSAEHIAPFHVSSSERTPELDTGITGPSSEDEEMSDPNDTDFNPSEKRRRRSSGIRRVPTSPPTTTTRAGRHIRKPSSASAMSIDAVELQTTPSGRVNKSKPSKKSRTPTTSAPSRPFFCPLMPYGCPATFPSKNEWKRHVSTQHVKQGYWRCELCQPTEGNGTTAGSYNDFNRKDLFTQHLKRMHADVLATNPGYTKLAKPVPNKDGTMTDVVMVEAIDRNDHKYMIAAVILDTLVKRCFVTLRALPTSCRCPICEAKVFRGETAWEERMDHLASHFERNKRSGSKVQGVEAWREDRELSEWLLDEGLVVRLSGGNWRLGDGKPRRLMGS